MIPQRQILKIISLLNSKYNIKITLYYKNQIQLLIAIILSAQCTDERVNKVTKRLFKRYKNIRDFAAADIKELEQYINPLGLYKNKARNIINCCKLIIERFNGKIPLDMKQLLELPGVGRKTANVFLAVYGKAQGIAIDTHVSRLSKRIGITNEKNPNKIEKDLMKIIPIDYWPKISLLLIKHGRKFCKARNPLCNNCFIKRLCKYSIGFNLGSFIP